MHHEDADLTDEALRDEIELVASLVVAASVCPGRMGQDEVDSLLGVGKRECAAAERGVAL